MGVENWGNIARGYKLTTRRSVGLGDLMHSIIIRVNYTELKTSKLQWD